MGSKARIAKYILPIILKDRKPNQWYVEPFCGGCNTIDKVDGNRIGNDINHSVIALFQALQLGKELPKPIDKSAYNDIRESPGYYPASTVGYAGVCCSYSGKWFGGYAGVTKTKNGIRDYQSEARANILAQLSGIKGIKLTSGEYFDFSIPANSIIYCDPPYEGTTSYFTMFNHKFFWDWCRQKAKEGHTVFISEYHAPEDFKCVWEMNVGSSLSANGKIGGNKISTEKLFTL